MMKSLLANKNFPLCFSVVASFLSGNAIIILCNAFIILYYFGRGAGRYVTGYVIILFMSLFSALLQGDVYFRGYVLAFFTFSSFAYIFIIRDRLIKDPDFYLYVVRLIKLHIFLSVLQFPIQLYQVSQRLGQGLGASIGDGAYGTVGHSGMLAYKGILSLLMLFHLVKEFSFREQCVYGSVILLSVALVGSNHTIIIALVSFLIAVLVSKKKPVDFSFKFSNSPIFISVFAIVIVIFNFYIFSDQRELVMSNMEVMRSKIDHMPRLIVLDNVIGIFSDNLALAVTGLGVGSFNSRASFILSGTYLWEGVNPFLGYQMSGFFRDYLLPYWNISIRNNLFISGTYFQPFSFYLTVLAEMGFFISLFAFFMLVRIVAVFRRLNLFTLTALLFFMGMCFIDNIPEYLNVASPFFIYLAYSYCNSYILKRGGES